LIHPRGYKAGEKATARLKALQMGKIELPRKRILGNSAGFGLSLLLYSAAR
jgi:hypothetical protein